MSQFKQNVIKIAREIPKGKVVSYGQLSLMAGIPKAAIVVGQIICTHGETTPWWRVVNSKGFISIKCSKHPDHDANFQRHQLEKDGVPVSDKLQVDIEKYRWRPDEKYLRQHRLDDEYVETFIRKFLL